MTVDTKNQMDRSTKIAWTREKFELRQGPSGLVTENESKAVLSAWGISTPSGIVVDPGAPLDGDLLQGLSGPFALKYISPDLVHKSEFGGVRLNVSRQQLGIEIGALSNDSRLAEFAQQGILVEQMMPPGVELVVGGYIDDSFGPVVMLGAGGILVELVEDVSTRICPVDSNDVRRMLGELKVSKLLNGFRGGESVSLDSIIDVILRIGGEDGLLMSLGDCSFELDINPLVVTKSGAIALDARILVSADTFQGGS